MRTRAIVLAVIAALLLAGSVTLPQQPANAAATTAGQVVVVSAPTPTSTYATVDAYTRQPDGRYRRMAHFTSARIGAAGMGAASETVARTPVGQFRLGQGFGVRANPGAGVPYFQVTRDDVWTGSTGSVINEHRRCAPGTCPASYGAFERLINYPGPYAYAAFIGYNAPPTYGTGAVAGRGSAFFLHVKNASATGGCVAIAESEMVWILRWMKSSLNPIISIGVGAAPYQVMPSRYI
jgi:L,D-peptidoglycan transpeptidase YkuD (ErfK/YbiS/YcfS/YnhG family)